VTCVTAHADDGDPVWDPLTLKQRVRDLTARGNRIRRLVGPVTVG
jgi:hypothetical protein